MKVNGDKDSEMKKAIFKKTIILLSVCIVLFIFLRIIDIAVYTVITKEHFLLFFTEYVQTHKIKTLEDMDYIYEQYSAPSTAKITTLILQGAAIFLISFLIERKKKYNRKYWVPSILMVLLINSISNSNFHYTPNAGIYLLYIISSILIGIVSIYLSIVAGKRKKGEKVGKEEKGTG